MIKHNLPDMFYGAKREIFQRAEELRKNMTESEKMLWQRLSKSQLGVRFKAQHPIDIFIVDFYCHVYKLVVEVDGGVHDSQKDYEGRTAELERLGIKVIRFTNDEVLTNTDEVVERIKNICFRYRPTVCSQHCPQPPKGGFLEHLTTVEKPDKSPLQGI